ncbi:aminoglycoside phosphotransferase family protein [Amycolatopsis sp. EV170708-02-1]|uniref:phosphotransferase n=1 Tax=Amycolatopsis sp. EV170708-02-1 TaxID=2919322 RepID=UPI001F0C6447|nr:aminoglycoside phosphotransferase family protein [Amycolatopsis sp. EV170708-02-1]UMP06416.1 aminoglycoside phosphotransferase family protein [Amycolatopsis sp. EV170708-02-1]
MTDGHTRAGVAAAVAIGDRFGLPTGRPEVLHFKSNVLVRLGPVVARVPGTTRLARSSPEEWLARDVELSKHLTERDVLVVSPTMDPPAGPHFADGLPVTLWHYTPHEPGHTLSPREVALSLARVHDALADYPGELPELGPVRELRTLLDRHGAAMGPALPRLYDELERVAAALPDGEARPLHGDAHRGNVVATAAGPCWLDFEDTWRGPLGWDLGVLYAEAGRATLDAYPAGLAPSSLEPFIALRRLFEVPWRFVIARRFPERLPEAEAALERYLSSRV